MEALEAAERASGEAAADAASAGAARRQALRQECAERERAQAAVAAEFARGEFDPIAFINQRFPTEHSLSGVEDASSLLRGATSRLEQDMMAAVREQASSKDRGEQELAAAKSAIHGLFDRIGQIQGKARQTESVVESICGGIRQLDSAKQNLTTTITALRRLQMLVQAVDQLERSTLSRQYRTAPGLLDATRQLAEHFDRYSAVPKIAKLLQKNRATVEILRRQVLSDIKRVVGDHDKVRFNPILIRF